jgi:hypothetical protein
LSGALFVALALLECVVLWELVARTADAPLLPLGPAEPAMRLGLVEAIAAKLERGQDRFALKVQPGHFVVVYARELELPGELAQLVLLDAALGEARGWRASGRN